MAKVVLPPAEALLDLEILFDNTNYSGHVFNEDYYIAECNEGPGWYIFGRNSEKYGKFPDGRGVYVMLIARPDLPPRAHKHYNGKVRRGWRRKHEAKAALAALYRAEREYKRQEEKAQRM